MAIRRRALAVAAGLAISGSVVAVLAQPANADPHNGSCQVLEVCFFYNSNKVGARHDFYHRVSNFAGYTFIGPGNGAGTPVKNNAASAANHDGFFTARVFYNSGYAGPADDVAPNTWRNLDDTYNDNASYTWCHGVPLKCNI